MAVRLASPPRTGRGSLPPDVIERLGGGGGSNWVKVARARNDIDAHLLSGRLGDAGVEVRLLKERGGPMNWVYGGRNPWTPVMVLVRRGQLEDALLVLAEISWEGPAVEPGAPAIVPQSEPPGIWRTTALALWIVLALTFLWHTARAIFL